jgi:hypothetical protein
MESPKFLVDYDDHPSSWHYIALLIIWPQKYQNATFFGAGQGVGRRVANQLPTLAPRDHTDPSTEGLQFRVRENRGGAMLTASTREAATDGLSRLYQSGNSAAKSGREMANPCTASHPIVRSHTAISSDSTPSTITLMCIAWPRLQIPRRRSNRRTARFVGARMQRRVPGEGRPAARPVW